MRCIIGINRGHGSLLPAAVARPALALSKELVAGDPDQYISTSYVERQNLSLRMGQRPIHGLTNGFSKKLDTHVGTHTLREASNLAIARLFFYGIKFGCPSWIHIELCAVPRSLIFGRFWRMSGRYGSGQSGKHLLLASISPFDPRVGHTVLRKKPRRAISCRAGLAS
jgi:hypothetical protein